MADIEFTSVAPIIGVRDLDGTLQRYELLGFTVRAYNGPARYGFADRGAVSLHISEWAEHDPKRTAASVYIYVDDADALFAEWTASGVPGYFIEPADTDYRLREFGYVDPEGTLHRVGSPLPVKVVSSTRVIGASAKRIFGYIADPAWQPRWDGNANLAEAAPGQRVHAVGDVFTMELTTGGIRENHVIEFEEARRIAWRPADPGRPPAGHLWRWELEPVGPARTRVTHTYDWSALTDPNRLPRAQATTAATLAASLSRLATLAEIS